MQDVRTSRLARKLQYWLAAIVTVVVTVSAKDCELGSLRCASVLSKNVELCHWDRPRLFKQPEIICDDCRKATLDDVIGVACNAIALRNWVDSEPIWLQAPLFASRDVGLIGEVNYELRRDMFDKVTIVGTTSGADVTFQRLKHRDDPMFRSIEVAACFEATITSFSKDGTPIHYTLTGPSKAIELKEPNLWVGAEGFGRLTLRPTKCRLNRGFKDEPPPVSTHSTASAAHGHSAAAAHQPRHDLQQNDPFQDLPPNSHVSSERRPSPSTTTAAQGQHAARNLEAGNGSDDFGDDEESVELVYPDGHVEVVSAKYVQQHFRIAQEPQDMYTPEGRPPGQAVQMYPPERAAMPYSPGVYPIPYARPGTQVPVAGGYPAPMVPVGGAGGLYAPYPIQPQPMQVMPSVYYVTGPNQALPANTNEYEIEEF